MTPPVELAAIELSGAGPAAAAGRSVAAITRERYAQLAGRVKLLVGFTDDGCQDDCCAPTPDARAK